MSSNEGRHTCDSPEWYSPSFIVEAARATMGGIDLDPASCEEANRIVQASAYYTKEEDGLVQDWFGRVLLNPPGGKVGEFWQTLCFKFAAGEISQAVYVGYSLEQFQTLQATIFDHPLDYPICIPAKRIQFVENEAKRQERREKLIKKGKLSPDAPSPKDSASHGNFICYLGSRIDAFYAAFRPIGIVR